MTRRGVRILVCLAVGAVGFTAHRALPSPASVAERTRFVPRPELARLLSFGFEALVGDFYWLRAVQLVGGDRANPARHGELLGKLVDVATTLDPFVDHPYRFAAIWLTSSEANVREANRLLRRGLAYHPLDWRNRFYLGFNHFFYLAEHAQAADVLEEAAGLEGAPGYLSRLVARLRAATAGLETAAAFLQELLRNTEDPYARAEYEKALDEIETERRARFLDRARAEYRRRSGRDIERVEDLIRGPWAVLPRLPPEPHDWEWSLDPESGRIVSSYYGDRYEVHFHARDAERRERWKREREQRERS